MPGNVGAVREGDGRVGRLPSHVTQPNFKKTYFDQYQLIVLTQFAKT